MLEELTSHIVTCWLVLYPCKVKGSIRIDSQLQWHSVIVVVVLEVSVELRQEHAAKHDRSSYLHWTWWILWWVLVKILNVQLTSSIYSVLSKSCQWRPNIVVIISELELEDCIIKQSDITARSFISAECSSLWTSKVLLCYITRCEEHWDDLIICVLIEANSLERWVYNSVFWCAIVNISITELNHLVVHHTSVFLKRSKTSKIKIKSFITRSLVRESKSRVVISKSNKISIVSWPDIQLCICSTCAISTSKCVCLQTVDDEEPWRCARRSLQSLQDFTSNTESNFTRRHTHIIHILVICDLVREKHRNLWLRVVWRRTVSIL